MLAPWENGYAARMPVTETAPPTDPLLPGEPRFSRADPCEPISDQLEGWLDGEGESTLGGLIDVFEEKSFALLFILLLGVSALPLPTGGATHVFDIIAVLVAAQ